MKVCFPVAVNNGLESDVFGHFGSAPQFIAFDTETQQTEIINNQDLGHEHGGCSPFKALDGKKVDALVVGGIGAGAIKGLHTIGVTVYRATKGTVAENIALFTRGELSELSAEHACGGHAGGCGH